MHLGIVQISLMKSWIAPFISCWILSNACLSIKQCVHSVIDWVFAAARNSTQVSLCCSQLPQHAVLHITVLEDVAFMVMWNERDEMDILKGMFHQTAFCLPFILMIISECACLDFSEGESLFVDFHYHNHTHFTILLNGNSSSQFQCTVLLKLALFMPTA